MYVCICYIQKDPDSSEPDLELMCQIGDSVRQALGIDLLGIDVIVEENTGRYGLIDVNPFPGTFLTSQ